MIWYLIVAGLALIVGAVMWWRSPDDLDSVRQRERALEAMKRWTDGHKD